MIEQAKQMYKSVSQNHENVYILAKQIREMTAALAEEKTEMADLIFAINESQKLADDTKKELNALRSQFDKLLCALCARDMTMGRIQTDYCSVSPEIKMAVSVPSKSTNPEGFLATMRAVGIPEALISGDTESVRLHYPGVCDMVTKLLQQGKPLPPGLAELKSSPQYVTRTATGSTKKGILEL